MEPFESLTPSEQAPRRKLVGKVLIAFLLMAAVVAGAGAGLLLVYTTDLPQVAELEHYRPSAVTELYDDRGRVIGSFALQRRIIASYDDYPVVLREAILSIEDKEFESHWGVNVWRVAGAAWRNLVSGRMQQGASTLTMQLSRNLFLSPDRKLGRKIQESLLAIQIERRFTKAQIFTMYANQIYLGHGNYGFESASQYYFSKPARDLTLEEAALLAGLPQSPESLSPINRPERALARRNLVLNAMLEDGKITAEQATRAKASPIRLKVNVPTNSLAPYFVEEVRQYLERKYGSDEVHRGGLRVYTTLNLELQKAANKAVLDGLAAYERRHGWKGKLRNVLRMGETLEAWRHPDWSEPIEPGSYVHALVTQVTPATATVKLGKRMAELAPSDIAWTGRRSPDKLLEVGDIVYVRVVSLEGADRAKAVLEQDSGAQGALLAMDNATGDIKAMVGGRDFDESKFNRATQALRQVGSSFKPYVYTAAIEEGMSPNDVVIDAPTVFVSGGGPYAPRNYDGKYEGAITLRRALAQSRNVPAVKVAEAVGINRVIDTARRFGVTSPMPPYLPVALGSAEVTLAEQTASFAVFPNDGVRVTPHYIRRVTDYDGRVLEENFPEVRDVISARTARIMTMMLQGVVQFGTAVRAKSLGHALAGKTGTTNDFTDAWFMGFSPSLTCGVWVGFDEKKTLGARETGGVAALPIWIDFMKVALEGRDGEEFIPAPPVPPTAIAQKIDTPDETPGDGEAH
ncbi:MAG TPA: PBP1A family penicillin-binding protein [Terriglobales bacterium]|nr:PBP1A family penicillin-binding protein [Terriglobales bacterium]